jgi:hypothetical protein
MKIASIFVLAASVSNAPLAAKPEALQQQQPVRDVVFMNAGIQRQLRSRLLQSGVWLGQQVPAPKWPIDVTGYDGRSNTYALQEKAQGFGFYPATGANRVYWADFNDGVWVPVIEVQTVGP